MAINPKSTQSFLQPETTDRMSAQDRHVENMTLEELRAWRAQTAKQLAGERRHASRQNQYIKDTVADIESGQRLSTKALERLLKSAKNKAGISAGELLEFTLGDTKRNRELKKTLNAAVLEAYAKNIKTASSKFLGGITPQEVINNSRLEDINRANRQIHLASVFKRKGNVISFMTNAGPKSKDRQHYVTIQLLDYPQLIFSRTRAPSVIDTKNTVINGKIRFDCDCGRHRFWYRYIASIGKYNFGVDENRYPSTRNPQLTGVACKHVLRVMKHLTSAHMVNVIQGYARDDIAKANNQIKPHRKTPKQLEREIMQQSEALNNWKGRLHWSKKIKQAVKTAEKEVKAEQKRQQARQPNMPTQAEKASFEYAKKQIGKKGVPDNFKQLYQTEINNYQAKWGNK